MLRRKRILVSDRLEKLIELARQLDTQYTLSILFCEERLYSTLSILSNRDIPTVLRRAAGQYTAPSTSYIKGLLRPLESYYTVEDETVECYTGDVIIINQFLHRGENRVSIFKFSRDGDGDKLSRIKRRALVNSVFYGAPFDPGHYMDGYRLRRVLWRAHETIFTPSTLVSLPKPILLCSDNPDVKAFLEGLYPPWDLIIDVLAPLLGRFLEVPRDGSMVRDLIEYIYSTTRSTYVNSLITLLDKTRVLKYGDTGLLVFLGVSIYSTALKLLPNKMFDDYGILVLERCRSPMVLPRWTCISWSGSNAYASIPVGL